MNSLKKIFFALLLTTLSYEVLAAPAPAPSTNCAGMTQYCSDVGASYASTVGTFAPGGNNYNCLGAQQGPVWFYLNISQAGNINLNLTAPSDIDFIIWGPFTSLANAQAGCGQMGNGGAGGNVIDCSFSGTNFETPSILGASVGQIYVMMVTNYAGINQTITLADAGSTGTALCCTPPVMTSPNAATICSGNAVNIPLTSTLAGTTYTWIAASNGSVTGEIVTLQTTATINNTLTNTTSVPQTVVYTVTPTNGCVGTPQTVNVTVNPAPSMTSPNAQTICTGTAVNIPLTSNVPATYSWIAAANANVTGESTTAQTTGTINNTLVNTTAVNQVVVYTVTPTSTPAGCLGITQTINVTVNPAPTMASANAATICSGTTLNFALTANLASTFTWIAAANPNVTGESTTLQTGSPINNTLTNTTAVAQTVTYTVTPTGTLAGCVGTPQTVNITVNPTPTMTSANAQSICSGTAVNIPLTSNLAGSTFTWIATANVNVTGESTTTQTTATINNTLVNTTAVVQTVTYTVTPTAPAPGLCPGVPQTVTVTVIPTPTVTSANAQTICSGTAVNIPLTSNVAGATYSWIATANANVTGESTTAQTTATINNTLVNTTAVVQTVTYTVTPTGPAPSLCPGTPQVVTITVNPTPTMTSAAAQTICSNTAVNIPLTSTVAGSTFSWIATANANVTGESTTAQTTGTINNTLVNTTAVVQTVTYTVTPTGPAPGLCPGTPQVVTVTVNPTPTMTSAAAQTICSNTAVNIPLTSNIAGSTFSWIATANANVTGESTTAQTTGTINNTLVNTTAVVQTVTYTVTPTGPAPSLCPGTPQVVTVTVNPTPTMTSAAAQTICSSTAVNIPLTSTVAGSTFSWIAAANANVTGESTTAQTTGTINDNLVNTTAAVQTVTYTVTPTGPAPSLCPGTPQVVTITVNPTPTMTSAAAQTICSNTAVNIPLTSTVAGSTFSWIAAANANVTGESTTSQTTATINNTLVNTTAVVQTVTYTVTPTGPAPGLCPGTPQVVTVTVNPTPTMTSAAAQTICSNTAVNIPLTSNIAGSTFSWIATANANVTGESTTAQTTGTINNTLVNTTAVVQTVTYTVTPTGPAPSLCPGTPQVVTVTVNPTPTMTSAAAQTICSSTAVNIPLTSTVAGSTFSWIAAANANVTGESTTAQTTGTINDNLVNTTAAVQTVTYTVTPTGPAPSLCPGTPQVVTVTVNPTPTMTSAAAQTICSNTAVNIPLTSTVAGSTFSWIAAANANVTGESTTAQTTATINNTLVNTTAVVQTVTYTVTPTGPAPSLCPGTPQVVTVTVNPTPTMTSAAAQTICSGGAVNIPLTSTVAGSTFSWIATANANVTGESTTAQTTGTINNTLVNTTAVVQTVTYTVTPTGPAPSLCPGTPQVVTVTVNPIAVIAVAGVNPTTCGGSDGSITITGLLATTNYSVSYNNPGLVGPAVMMSNGAGAIVIGGLPAGTYTGFTVVLNGCTSTSATVVVLADPNPPIVNDPADQTLCANTATAAVNFTGTAGATFTWTNNTPSIGLGAGGVGNIPSFVATNATALPVVATITVTPSLAGCTGTSQIFTITVNPLPTMTSSAAQTICSNTAVNIPLTSNIAGSTFSWIATANANVTGESTTAQTTGTINNTLVNTTAVVQTVTYTVTPTGPAPGLCPGTPQVVTVTVNPTPTMTSAAAQTICSSTAVNIPLTSTVAGSTFSWIAAANANVTGESTTAQTTGTINDNLVNTTAAVQTVTYTVTPTGPAPSLCPGTPQVVTITVNPTPTMTSAAAQTICSNTAVNIPLTSTVAGSTFSWIAAANANVTGESTTAQTTATINNTLVNTTAVVQTVTYTVTPTGPAPSLCPGTAQVVTVTVNPTPTMTSAAAQTICSGAAVNIPLTSTVAGSTFSWIATANANVTGESTTAQTTGTINNTLVNTTAVVQTVTYTVTPTGPAPSLCPGTPQVVTVTVDPIATVVVAGANPTTCSGSDGSITITGLQATTNYSVSYNNPGLVGPAVMMSNGAGAIVIGGLPSGTYSGFTLVLNGCTSTSPTIIVLADPNPPIVNDPADQTLCANTATAAVNFTGTAGATFTWTNNAPSIGLGAGGVGNIPSFVATNATALPVVATITVTPSLAGCVGLPQTFTITVNPIPTVTDPADQSLCANALTTAVNFVGTAGATFNWANSNATIGLVAAGSGNIASFTGLNAVPGTTNTGTITVTPVLAGCTGTPQTFTIAVVNTLPSLNCPGNLTAVCSITEQPAYANFAAFTGAGGTASSVGGVIQPATFTLVSEVSNGLTCPETVTRTYSIQDNCGSTATCVQTITVDDNINPTGTAPAAIAVQCIGNVPVANPALITDEADNCAPPVVAFVSDVSNGLTCPEIITRTYSITDACGNTINVTQVITVDDTTNPTASNPAAFNGTAVPAPDPTVVIDEADNCSVPVVAFVSDVTDGLNCPETITRTYSVTDACGNTINVTQLIIIGDPFPPTASNPAPVAVQCLALVPVANPAVVIDEADNNGIPVVAFVSDVSNGLTCPEIITRTYSVTDICGNAINVTQIITVDDNINPTGTAPANVNVQCLANVPVSDITLITDEADNCAVPTVTFIGDVSNGLTCPETITRTYRITDACGNFIDVTQTIVVDDTTNPTASNPVGVTVQCIGDVPASDPLVVIDEADNCSVPVVAFVSDVSNGLTCPETITRTYSVTDACGNTINVTQTIIVDDTTNPTSSNPAIVIVPGGPAPAPDPLVVIDEADNCSVPVVAFVSDVTDGNPCPETITRTYSVTDACGNQILVTQIIQITDPIMPTASNPVAVNVQCIGQVPAPDVLVVTDEADNNGIPTVAYVSDVSDGNTCPEVITRTYSVTDVCGNQMLVTQTITVDDNINPTGTAPANVNVQCLANVPVSDITLITDEADNCAVPTVTFIGDVSNGLTCPETITRTYRITDACGNFIDVTQTIVVDDTTNPTASNPAGVTVECIGDVPAADPLVVIDEADNCSVPVVAFVGDLSDGNTCPETITRTYSVTDACGNTINVTQTIIVDDTTNPTASDPATVIVPGGPAPAVDPLVVIDEADNCSVPVVAFVVDVSDGNLCPETITRIYSVTDACGNQILVTQIIQITDPIMPTASNPAAINVQCIGQVPAPDVLVVTDAADNNGSTVVAFVSDVSDGLTCPETITRTYSVTDICNNQILVTQLIIVNDITPPTASNPVGVTVQCIGDVPASDILVVTDEADNCTVNPVVVFVGDVSDGNTCPETITRTYSVTDDCGNTINVTQTIIVDDTTNPTASNPAGVTVQCIGDVPANDPLVVIDEADNCSVPVVAFVSDVSDGNTCPETITRTYSVTDACGNTINVTQTIIVDDTTNPTASNPAGVTVDIIANVPAPDPLVVIDEADNCSVPTVVFVSDVSDGNTCPETITRTYSVTDACGNQITVTQTIIVSDLILPTASNPVTVNVECIGQVPVPDILVVTDEADNSGVPVVAFVSDVSDGLTCPETITRTYSITDACANSIMVTQLIIVNDITLPTASNPVGVTVQCIGDVPANDILVVTDEADNCTVNPIVAFVSDVSDGNTCPETITRTYSVTDDCGNTINVTQTIIVDDTTNPTASNPAGVTVECIGDVPAANTALVIDEADNCSVPVVVFVGDVSDGNTCPETITRTYSVTDACGNTINVTQTIIVDDTTNPTASNPAVINVACASNVPAPDPTVVTTEADNCTAAPIVAWVSDLSDNNVCNNETITRTYSVTDNCGNTINVTQQIIIGVTTPTVNAGIDQAVCDGEQVTLTASNPDAAVITWNNGITNSVAFTPAVGTTVYTVTASQCGGECTSTDQVTVVVNPNPVVAFVADTLIGCAPLEVTFVNQSSILGNNCQWTFGDGSSALGCDSVTNIYNTTGVFDVSLTVTTLEGCTSSVTYNSYITIADAPVAEFTYSPPYVSVENTEVQFDNTSINADDFVWNFGDFLVGSYQINPAHTFPAIGNMSYTVTLTASNYAGCVDTATAIVTIEDVIIFYVPNVFTPDGNSINNTFFPVFTSGYDVYDYHLTIFNRWGEVLFESYDASVGWSGTYGDQGLVQDGVYIWQIEFGETMSDIRHKKRGHVTVLK